MPELPDVEAVIGRIREKVVGQRITCVSVLDERLAAAEPGLGSLSGRTVVALGRRGKYILVSLDDGRTVAIHLRMTGNLIVCNRAEAVHRHTRLVIGLDDGGELRMVDQRRLGTVQIARDLKSGSIPGLIRMGPEPLTEEFTLERFRVRLGRRRGMVKSALLDQSLVAGIGNVYGDEILFQSGIRPDARVEDLGESRIETLYDKIRSLLQTACEHYADLHGRKDWFMYGRSRGYCVRCGGGLDRRKIQGRYSWFCPRCQDG